MAGRLKGRVALVTGGAMGLGKADCERLADDGATVIVTDREVELAHKVAEEIGEQAIFTALDVAERDQWEASVDALVDRYGGIDILVNNAATNQPAPMDELPMEAYDRIIAVGQTGVWLGVRTVAPLMRGRGGSIVNISSDAGMFGMQAVAAYSTAKFAVRGITRSAAIEFAPRVRVNSVHPGFIDTPATRPQGVADALERNRRFLGIGVPMGRIGTPREVANLVLFLASDESSYCTGAEFVIDGGTLAGPVPD